MGFSTRHDVVLKLVHPGRHVEVFRESVTAGEIMDKYPRHCVARPDFFTFPWIVVHPESVLMPGKVFYLVPFHTMDDLMKKRRHQQQQQQYLVSSNHHQPSKTRQVSPTKSMAWVAPKHQQHERFYKKPSRRHNASDQESCEDTRMQDPDTGSSYKPDFFRAWNKMRRNLNQPQERSYDQLDSSPFGDGSSPCFSITDGRWPRVTCPEKDELLRIKSCLRKPDSAREKLNLKVTFACPVVASQ